MKVVNSALSWFLTVRGESKNPEGGESKNPGPNFLFVLSLLQA